MPLHTPPVPMLPTLTTPAYGADWSPEQWDAATIDRDITLMVEARVTLVSIGIFSWARLEPRPGVYDLDWLVDVVDRLHAAGIAVDLATGTASPPAWMATNHPESLPVTAEGVRLGFGSRQQYCPSSAVYRERSRALAAALAERLGSHPGVLMWHINNEYACHVHECFCDACAAGFRTWLLDRHGDIAGLNTAWGTDFWSQRYATIDEVHPPAAAPTFLNPGQVLDWRRFCDAQVRTCFEGELEEIRARSDRPVTTNFMGAFPWLDYHRWSPLLDLVSDDSYPDPADPGAAAELAFTGDLMRGLGGGAPWLCMEQSPGAVQWRSRNASKRPGQHLLWSLARVAHGADGILQFQWRQSQRGAETFHAAMVPHAGRASRTWHETLALGEMLERLGPVVGQPTHAQVAVVVDWESQWARDAAVGPTAGEATFGDARRWHRSLWEAGYAVDLVGVDDDLHGYGLVVVPGLVVDRPHLSAQLAAAADAGTHVIVAGPAAIVDDALGAVLGGYLGTLQDLLGVRVVDHQVAGVTADSFYPSHDERGPDVFRISRTVATPAVASWHGLVAAELKGSTGLQGGRWAEVLAAPLTDRTGAYDAEAGPWPLAEDVEVVATFDGSGAGLDLAGRPAVTRRRTGRGAAWYVATDLDAPSRATLLDAALDAAGVAPVLRGLPDGVEAQRRGDVLFLLNHASTAALVRGVEGIDLLTGLTVTDEIRLDGLGAAVIVPQDDTASS